MSVKQRNERSLLKILTMELLKNFMERVHCLKDCYLLLRIARLMLLPIKPIIDTILEMIPDITNLEKEDDFFVYRPFFVQGSRRKTYHEGASDKKAGFADVWRLAPRRKLV